MRSRTLMWLYNSACFVAVVALAKLNRNAPHDVLYVNCAASRMASQTSAMIRLLVPVLMRP